MSECPSSIATISQSWTLCIRIVESMEPEAISLPEGENAQQITCDMLRTSALHYTHSFFISLNSFVGPIILLNFPNPKCFVSRTCCEFFPVWRKAATLNLTYVKIDSLLLWRKVTGPVCDLKSLNHPSWPILQILAELSFNPHRTKELSGEKQQHHTYSCDIPQNS